MPMLCTGAGREGVTTYTRLDVSQDALLHGFASLPNSASNPCPSAVDIREVCR